MLITKILVNNKKAVKVTDSFFYLLTEQSVA
ncbi:hypothetical protein JCM5805K_2852 [Lactococcus lactis subsp. lactis]|uniref:Uncharacterized protein n=1 Tax=Lactococcus lactis subsp. lactis TaxID=1360 RepID=A0A0B8R391_LACLL|nr:hypothetical protein JCM5805K_2852 [Lactococcus lactis subsp. lactis]